MAKKLYLILIVLLFGAMVYAGGKSQNCKVPFNHNNIQRGSSQKLKTNNKLKSQGIHRTAAIHEPARFDENEFLISMNSVPVPAMLGQNEPSVASDGSGFFVVWEDDRKSEDLDIFGVVIDQSGRVLNPAGLAITTATDNQENPSVAFDGLRYLVVWEDSRNGNHDIYGARIGRFGTLLDTNGFAISNAEADQFSPSVAFDGTNFLVVWEDYREGEADIYGARVTTNGVVIDSSGIAISNSTGGQYSPQLAFADTNFLVVWQDSRNGYHYDIYGARVNQAGQIIDTTNLPISVDTSYQENPSIAFDGTNYLVAWQDFRSSRFKIFGARVNQSGEVIDSSGFVISTGAQGPTEPFLAFDGTNYLVVWNEPRGNRLNIYGTRVSTDGNVLDTNGIFISVTASAARSPAVTANSNKYFVVWEDDLTADSDIFGTRVTQSGAVLDSISILVSTGINSQREPSAAFDGTNYLVVWEDLQDRNYIYCARVNQYGTVLDTNGIFISNRRIDPEDFSRPSVAFDGSNFLVIWNDYLVDNIDSSYIYGARINRDGLVLDPYGFPVSRQAFYQWNPSIAYDGTNYLVVWADERGHEYNIFGTRLTPTGLVLDPAGIPISTAPSWQSEPSVAFDGTNYLVVWLDWRTGYPEIYGARVNQFGSVLDPDGFQISNETFYYKDEPAIAFDGTNYLVVWQGDRTGDDNDIFGARVNQSGVVLDSIGITITTAEENQEFPSVVFNGNDYLVAWEDWRAYYYADIYGAKVSNSGVVIDTFAISTKIGNKASPNLSHGGGNQVLITFSGWAGVVDRTTYNTMRIWGMFYPFVGIEEERPTLNATRFALDIYPNPTRSFLAIRLPLSADRQILKIFDVSGKLVNEIATPTEFASQSIGTRSALRNDRNGEIKISLKGISPGIYFLKIGKETKKFLVVK
jgi:Secretion system C-terminal sorting domain